jgi:hypothetical protein
MAARKRRQRPSRAVRRSKGKRSEALPGLKKRARGRHRSPDRGEVEGRVPSGEGSASDSPTTGSDFKQSGLGTAALVGALPLGQRGWKRRHGTSPSRLTAVLLPGLTFFDLGRPASGLVCYALQASLVGWLPAALWAALARRQLAKKQRQLAARLR